MDTLFRKCHIFKITSNVLILLFFLCYVHGKNKIGNCVKLKRNMSQDCSTAPCVLNHRLHCANKAVCFLAFKQCEMQHRGMEKNAGS